MKKYYIQCTTFDCRSLYVYKNGNLYCQLNDSKDCGFQLGDKIIIRFRNAIIKGKFYCYKPTGIVLYNYVLKRV